MDSTRASQTAGGAAALRADHLLHHEPVVFRDPHALALAPKTLRASVESGAFGRRIEELGLRPTQGHVLARARFCEEALEDARRREGLAQYALLAAGLDSFALRRDPAAGPLRVYEVDHPASQRAKRERLRELGGEPAGVEFVALDFESDSLETGLARSGFDPARPAFFSWLGVCMYLTREAVRRTLESIRACAAPGSRLVLDYPLPFERLDPGFREVAERKNAMLASGGEPRISTFDPDELHAELAGLGFELADEATPAEIDARWFRGRRDGLRSNPENRIAHFRAAG